MKISKYIIIGLLLVGCNAPRAVYDFDPEINFRGYNIYAYFPEFQSGLSELDEKRLKNSLQRQLQEKGLNLSDEPQLYVNVYTDQFRDNASRSNIGIGVGGGSRNVGVGVSGGIPVGGPETIMQFTFDFVDVIEDSLVWQAVVEIQMNQNQSPEDRQALIDKVIQKALEGYPPR